MGSLSLVAETLAAFCIEVGFELDTRSEYTITRLLERVRAGELNENYDLMLKEVPGASMRPARCAPLCRIYADFCQQRFPPSNGC